MKCLKGRRVINAVVVAPSRGAWIEIGEAYIDGKLGAVAPLAGGVD